MCPHHTSHHASGSSPPAHRVACLFRSFRKQKTARTEHEAPGEEREKAASPGAAVRASSPRVPLPAPAGNTACLKHVFSLLDAGDLRSARLVCKSWDVAGRSVVTSLCPTSAARPSRITTDRYPALVSLDLTLVRGWGRFGCEAWIPAIKKVSLGVLNRHDGVGLGWI